jgi:histidinol-phosphatase (PHP family)
MIIDLHNHTPLCNHATGDMQEYINKAIKKGIKVFGFSDHAPMNFDEKYRMKFEEMQQYENEVLKLKEKYKDEIKILLGYEVDFTPMVDERVLKREVDYLIGSVHFLDNWGFDNPEFIKEWENRDVDDIYNEYFSKIIELANSKLFDIVAHLDLIKVFGYKPKEIKIEKVLEAIKDNNLTIEINTAGLRKPVKEIYPSIPILEKIKRYEIDITFGSDAHSPQQVGLNLQEAINIAKQIGFKKAVYFEKREKIYVNIC